MGSTRYDLRYGVKQYVGQIIRETGGFAVFTSVDSKYWLFAAFVHDGSKVPTMLFTGFNFPVLKTRLRDDVKRALNRGCSIDLRPAPVKIRVKGKIGPVAKGAP